MGRPALHLRLPRRIPGALQLPGPPNGPLGTLIVVNDTQRETWNNFGQVGYYLGPSFKHYRNYRCLITDSDSIRIGQHHFVPRPAGPPRCKPLRQILSVN